MKVLIVQDHRLNGGAAKAAWRLGEALHRLDYEVIHVCGDEGNRTPREAIRLNGKPQKGPSRWWDALRPDIGARRCRVNAAWGRTLELTQPDRIWFHNLAGAIKWGWSEDLLRKGMEQCPCLWTLHDMWALGSGRNYFPSEESGQEGSVSPLRRILAEFPAGRLRVVAPSTWLANLACSMTGVQVEQLTNPLDEEIFRPFSKPAARAAWGFDDGQRISVAVAENLQDKRKGMAFLVEAWKEVRRNPKDLLCLVGRRPSGLPNIPGVRFLGTILSPSELAMLYSAADIFVHPAEMENAPCVIQESMACGCPVLARPVGGIPELLSRRPGGWMAEGSEFATMWRELLEKSPLPFRFESKGGLPAGEKLKPACGFSEKLTNLLPPAQPEKHRIKTSDQGCSPPDLDLRLGGEENLYHWLVYHLLGALLWIKEGHTCGKVLVSGVEKDFHALSLNGLGISTDRIERIEAKEPRKNTVQVAITPTANSDFNILYRELGSRLSNFARGPGCGRRIYITRRDATKRRVANEEELIGELVQKGFTVVCPGELPWPEQIAAFASADWIIGPHGAAFSNILFSRAGSRLVELFPAEENLWYFGEMARSVGVIHHAFQGNPSQKKGTKRESFLVPIKPFRAYLKVIGL